MGESKIITKPNGELFNPDLAQRAITFINMLKHTKGGKLKSYRMYSGP